nr:sugar phosphate isomerase/epimerase [uncultured Clostridium sp.]
MELSCSVYGIVDTSHPKQGIRDMANAGFISCMLDFDMFGSEEDIVKENYRTDLRQVSFETISHTLKSSGLKISVAKAQTINAQEVIHASEAICCDYVIVPPLWYGLESGQEWKENKLYYLNLAKECEHFNTKILLTNLCRNLNGHLLRGICSDVRLACQWIDELNKEVGMERFGFCMDVGHCNIGGQDMHEFAMTLGKRLHAVSLKDNYGEDDSALLPFTNSNGGQPVTDWLSLVRGLRQCGFNGQLILEISDTVRGFSPILRPQLLSLAKSIGDYFQWQIGIENALKKYKFIILFGAGNMCRNFMKCYGEKYKPLFTCDNNSSLWGTDFEGLEVKNPGVLRDIPADCGIFICNIYYREIETQLRALGVKNVEYFNDEYMPSFYFDRLEKRRLQ